MPVHDPYPSISDYALIGDCHSSALVSRWGSVDWCCMPRFDSPSVFARLLDWEAAGFCSVAPADSDYTVSWRYIDDSLVLETTFYVPSGKARLLDCFAMRAGGRERPRRQLVRIAECVEGSIEIAIDVVPRFDYGSVRPWLRREGPSLYSAIGSAAGLVVWSDAPLVEGDNHDLKAGVSLDRGARARLSMQFVRPERLDAEPPAPPESEEVDRRLEETLDWWERWSSRAQPRGRHGAHVARSAIVLKALTNAPTGAITAAPTTSLPEFPGGVRNWDYRYSWIRDSVFTVRTLANLGCHAEADGFRRFVQRSAAGSADELQIMYGVGGERRLTELVLEELDGYNGARPVRIGNAACDQVQLDVYGELLQLAWLWYERGRSPDDDYWRFLVGIADEASARWREKDRGLWEMRGEPRHFVHSKVMCWLALDRAIRLARELRRDAPLERWEQVRREIRARVEREGYDADRGVFVQAFGERSLDAALLRLPSTGFVAYDDPRMMRTVDAIRSDLDDRGFILRYVSDDGLPRGEGVFLTCSFWLAECLAHQGRVEEARRTFDQADAAANDLGLFSEEYDVASAEMLGNYPQGLTHLSHIEAALAIADAEP